MMAKKIHIGCGTIYLDGYINMDLQLPHHHLAAARPDLVEINITTTDNYYKNDVTRTDIETRRLQNKEVVVDMFGKAECMPFDFNSLDEVRSVQLFEHFSFDEGKALLAYWYALLRKCGKVHIDIPDLVGTAEGISSAETATDQQWYTRLMFGSQRNEHNFHKAMYSKETIAQLLDEVGFHDIKILPNIHFYPAFAVEGTK